MAPGNKIVDLNPDDGLRSISFTVPEQPAEDRATSFAVLLVVTDSNSPNLAKSTSTINISLE